MALRLSLNRGKISEGVTCLICEWRCETKLALRVFQKCLHICRCIKEGGDCASVPEVCIIAKYFLLWRVRWLELLHTALVQEWSVKYDAEQQIEPPAKTVGKHRDETCTWQKALPQQANGLSCSQSLILECPGSCTVQSNRRLQ